MRWFVRHDLDGFFGLFVDNLVQLLLIVALCSSLCGMTGDDARFIYKVILPGAAVSILVGNVFYAWQAHRVARREGRDNVTALPYGINTPSLIIYAYFVMAPAYRETGSAEAAWAMGLVACLGSGVIELTGALVAERVRKRTPRAALLSTLAGIAIGFIAMTFALQIWARPIVAMLPMAIVLVTYFSGVSFPLGLPGGLVAIAAGTLIAWIVPEDLTGVAMSGGAIAEAWTQRSASWPVWCGGVVWEAVLHPAQWLKYISVIVPMGLFNVIGSLQNIESAEAGDDRFHTGASLAANGIGTVAAACFGSCFPTTIYIGHPGWKALGARAGYSTLNGLAITALCLSGTLAIVQAVVPMEAGIAIVLWIGIVITAQAFQATPREHAPAVALGLFPAIAAWGATCVFGAFVAAGENARTMQSLLEESTGANVSGFLLHGLIVMEHGYIFVCMVIAALSAHLIDRRFYPAALWALLGAAAAITGLSHAYVLDGNAVGYLLIGTTPPPGAIAYRAYDVAVGYLAVAAVLAATGYYLARRGSFQRTA
ncbi:MAG: NCS2 family permease [Phycisphaerales bacterium]|nr:MAG: NCS2 family permease [Phycisphaerales bacterium]